MRRHAAGMRPLRIRPFRANAGRPTLSAAEERALAVRGRDGDPGAIDILVRSYRAFVVSIARKYGRYGVPMNDLVQEGTIGLIQAIRRFDPDQGVRLSTYARAWIMAAIQDCVVRSWSLVRLGTSSAQKALFFHLRKAAANLRGGADAMTEDLLKPLAQRLGVPVKEAMALARRAAGFDWSLNRPMRAGGDGEEAGDGGREWLDRLADDAPTPEERVAEESERRFVSGMVARALDRLPYRERIIITARYFSEMKRPREAIGRDLGLSKERVRQLELKALDSLRRFLAPLRGAHGV